jgi:hypothetical protein
MTAASQFWRPAGALATTLGGLAGAFAGAAAGVPIANANASDGLEGLGQALLILLVSLCLGSAIGVALALRLSRHERPLTTAILALPAVFFAIIAALRLASSFDHAGVVVTLQVVLLIVTLWLVRVVTMVWNRPRPENLRAS